MKILHIVDYIGPHGGLYQILEKLYHGLAQFGIEQEYLALKETPYQLDEKLVTLPMDVLAEGQFYEYLADKKPDLIHIHSDISNEYFAYCIRHFKTIRSIFDWGPFCPRPVFDNAYCHCDATFSKARDEDFIHQYCLPENCIDKECLPQFEEKMRLLKQVEKIIVLSDANKEYAISMGIPEEKIFKMPPIMEPPKTFAPPVQENILLFAGRIVYHKGTEFLLRSLTKVKNKTWKVILEGTGDPAYVTELMRFAVLNGIEDKIEVVGHNQYEQYLEMFQKVKILIFPSVYAEGFGYPGYEAMLNGIPIIAFEGIGGVREWLRDGYNGIAVPFQDIDKMAAAIDRLLADSQLYTEYRNNSMKWSQSIDYNQEIAVMKEMYHTLFIGKGENEMAKEQSVIESCIRKCFSLDEGIEFDMDRELSDYGMNSISYIKLLVLLEAELDIEFDENTFSLAEYKTPNDIMSYIDSLKNELPS